MTIDRKWLPGLAVAGLALFVLLTRSAGFDASMAAAGALVVLTVGLWATGALAEHLVTLIFFLFAMIFAIAPADVVFSGFATGAFWLVFGGMIIGAAVDVSGLGKRIASRVFRVFGGSYLKVVTGIVTVDILLAFLMPSTMGRVVLLLPIVAALADALGYEEGSPGRRGMMLSVAFGSYLGPVAILPANVPNNILIGASEHFYGITLRYFDYLALHFPVLGLLKSVLLVLVIVYFFADRPKPVAQETAAPRMPLSGQEKRLALVLSGALILWVTDALHGISPAWISLGAGMICIAPGVTLLPANDFRDKVPFIRLIFVAGVIGIGAMVAHTGLGKAFSTFMLGHLALDPETPMHSFFALSGLTTLLGAISTMPGVPAIITPLASDMVAASGLPIETVLMTIVIGVSTVIFPYQVPPLVVAMQIGRIPVADGVKVSLATALGAVVLLWPLDYLWWQFLGYIP